MTMPKNPFGDYSTVDLSSIYTNAAGAGGGVGAPPPTGGGTGTPTAPGGQFPGAGTGGGNNFGPGDPQYTALQNPGQPYLDTSTSGGIAYTPSQAQAWWNNWMANPVNLLTVPPVLLPGSLTNDPATLAKIAAMSDAAPAAPHNYNPLNLTIDAGQGTAGYGDGSTWDAVKNLEASSALTQNGNNTPAQASTLAALKSLGVTNPVYTGAGTSTVAANPAAVPYNAGVPTYVTDPKTGVQSLQYQTPGGQAYGGVVPGSSAELQNRANAGGSVATPNGAATPDYAALANTDRKYAANLATSDPAKSQQYLARAKDYESRIPAATPGPGQVAFEDGSVGKPYPDAVPAAPAAPAYTPPPAAAPQVTQPAPAAPPVSTPAPKAPVSQPAKAPTSSLPTSVKVTI